MWCVPFVDEVLGTFCQHSLSTASSAKDRDEKAKNTLPVWWILSELYTFEEEPA